MGLGSSFVTEVFPNKEDEKVTVRQSQVVIRATTKEEHGSAFHFMRGWNEIVSLGRGISSKCSVPNRLSDMKSQFPA